MGIQRTNASSILHWEAYRKLADMLPDILEEAMLESLDFQVRQHRSLFVQQPGRVDFSLLSGGLLAERVCVRAAQ